MRKNPNKKRRAFTKKMNPNKIPMHRSYLVKDIADIYDKDESTVFSWVREEGLIPIDAKSPIMIYWETARQFIAYKRDSLKFQTANVGDMPCMSCKLKKRAYKDQVTITPVNEKVWSMQARCVTCGSKMNMRVSASMFQVQVTWGYQVVDTLPVWSMNRRSVTSTSTTGKKKTPRKPFVAQKGTQFNAQNERIKHQYFARKSLRYDAKTMRKLAKALAVFDDYFEHQNYKSFAPKKLMGIQKYVLRLYSSSLGTANRTMTYIREFFFWLREQDGYKKIKFNDVDDLFQLSLKDQERSKTSKPRNVLDFELWENTLFNVLPQSLIEARTQAVIACFLLTGIRVQALCSLQIRDFYNLDSDDTFLFQDANHVDSKKGKSAEITFYNLDPRIKGILLDWIKTLKRDYGFTDDDPIFPTIRTRTDNSFNFIRDGYINIPLKSTTTIRNDLESYLLKCDIEGITPHSVRHSATCMFLGFELTPEQIKAISQNMTHSNVATTLNSYARLPDQRQRQVIKDIDVMKLRRQKKLKQNPKYQYILSQLDDSAMIDIIFDLVTQAE